MRTNEIKNEIDEIRRWGEKMKQRELKYGKNKQMFIWSSTVWNNKIFWW